MRHIYAANGDIIKTVETVDGMTHFGSHQDVEPYLRQNAADRNSGTNGFTHSRTMRKIADVPMNLLVQWMREDGVNYFQMRGPERNAWLRRKVLENPKMMTVDGGI